MGLAPAHQRGLPILWEGLRLYRGQLRGEPEQVIERSEGSLLAPPRWAWHHFNLATGLLRTMRPHQIEPHPVQLSPEEAATLLSASQDG